MAVVWGSAVGRERADPARAAVRPLSSYGGFDRAALRPGTFIGTAAVTAAGRADTLGHRLYLSHSASGATCVLLMDTRTAPGGIRCRPHELGAPARPGEVFVRVPEGATPQPGRVAIEGLAAAGVHVRLLYADGRSRAWIPRDGVFGDIVAAPRSVELVGAGGRVLLRQAVPRSLGAG